MDKSTAYYIGKGVASVAVCAASAFCAYVTNDADSMFWAAAAMLFIW